MKTKKKATLGSPFFRLVVSAFNRSEIGLNQKPNAANTFNYRTRKIPASTTVNTRPETITPRTVVNGPCLPTIALT